MRGNMGRLNISLFFIFFIIAGNINSLMQKKLVIVTASYNNGPWINQYFNSIIAQTYDQWKLIYIDDNSTDDTHEQINFLIEQYHIKHKVQLIKNINRHGHLCNQYQAINQCEKDAIVLIIDGDDWLAHDYVFEIINKIYQDENIWLTYGQFWYLKKNKKGFCRPIPSDIIEKNGIRQISWRTSHLRTFYAGLFQQIKYQDLLYHESFYPKCADVVTMFAMIEMAGKHIMFIPDILYIYNDDNPLSYHHDPTHQREIESYIRTQERYQPLKERPW